MLDFCRKNRQECNHPALCIYRRNVEIGDDCIIMSGAKILHGTRMGKGNKVHHNAVLGAEPQDFHYTGENSMLIIGDNNDIRENVVVSRATHAGSATPHRQ